MTSGPAVPAGIMEGRGEDAVLSLAAELEAEQPWVDRRPPIA